MDVCLVGLFPSLTVLKSENHSGCNMKEIISKLMNIEQRAGEVYSKAASYYAADPELSNFLECLAEDELLHFHLLANASECCCPDMVPDLILAFENDEEPNILRILAEVEAEIESETITKESLLNKVIQAELTEWNEIFIYVVNSFKHETSGFVCPITKIQAHKKQMEYFFEHILEDGREKLKQIKKLPDVWRENILIVDDNDMVRDLLKSLLNPEGNIDLACNGLEALKLIGEKEFKLIVSDVDMPVMDGLTFYGQVVKRFPGLKDRFLFVSGNTAPERVAFFRKFNLNFIAKPMSVKLFRKKAMEIMLSKDCCLLCK